MPKPDLHLVEPTPKPETLSEKVQRLQREAQQLAADHVRTLSAAMTETQAIVAEIAAGGGVYHPGCQELAQRIADDLASKLLTLNAISERVS